MDRTNIINQAMDILYNEAVNNDFIPEGIETKDDFFDWIASKDVIAIDKEENAEYTVAFLEGVYFAIERILKDV